MKNTKDKDINKIQYYYREHKEYITGIELLRQFKFSEIEIVDMNVKFNNKMDLDNLRKVVLQNDRSLLFEYINVDSGKYCNEVYIRNENKEYEIS